MKTSAVAAVAEAKAKLTRLRIIVREAEARDVQSRDAAKAAQEAAEDKALASAVDTYLKDAQALAAALPAYVAAYRKLTQSGEIARGLVRTNPRARQDLAPEHPGLLIGKELARLTVDGIRPPGTDAWTAASTDTRTLEPLADHVAGLVSAIKGSVGR